MQLLTRSAVERGTGCGKEGIRLRNEDDGCGEIGDGAVEGDEGDGVEDGVVTGAEGSVRYVVGGGTSNCGDWAGGSLHSSRIGRWNAAVSRKQRRRKNRYWRTSGCGASRLDDGDGTGSVMFWLVEGGRCSEEV